MCEPYKSPKTISGLAKPTSNHFLQFSLVFFNLLQFASCSFSLPPIFSFLLTVFLLSSFFFQSCFSFEGIFSTYQPCRSNTRIKAKIPEPPDQMAPFLRQHTTRHLEMSKKCWLQVAAFQEGESRSLFPLQK